MRTRLNYFHEVRWKLQRFVASLCGAGEPVIRSRRSLPQQRKQLVTPI